MKPLPMKPVRAILEIALVIAASTALEFAAPQLARIVTPILVLLLGADFILAKQGRWLFLAAVAIVPFPELQSAVAGPLQLHHTLALLAAVAAAIEWFRTRPRMLPRPTWRLLAYYAVLVGITLVQYREVESWHRLTILAFLFLLAALATHYLRTWRDVVQLAYVVAGTSIVAVAIGLGAFYLAAATRTYFENPYIHMSTTEGVPRLAGTLLDSNFLGMHLLLVLPGCYAWVLARRRHWTVTATAVLLSAALLLTYSRSAYLGAAAGIIAAVIMLRPSKLWPRLVALLVGAGLLATVLYPPFPFYSLYRTPNLLIPTATKERLLLGFDPRALVEEYRQRVLNDPSLSDDERDQLLARDVSSDSLGYRISFWKAGLAMFRDNPLIGVGVGQFRYRFADYDDTLTFLREPDTHNIYVEQLAETGLVGIVFLIWVFGAALVGLWRVRGEQRVVAAATFGSLLGILVQSFLLGGFGAMPLFLTLGVAGALIVRAKNLEQPA